MSSFSVSGKICFGESRYRSCILFSSLGKRMSERIVICQDVPGGHTDATLIDKVQRGLSLEYPGSNGDLRWHIRGHVSGSSRCNKVSGERLST